MSGTCRGRRIAAAVAGEVAAGVVGVVGAVVEAVVAVAHALIEGLAVEAFEAPTCSTLALGAGTLTDISWPFAVPYALYVSH